VSPADSGYPLKAASHTLTGFSKRNGNFYHFKRS
jgi:hypothetical protein